jgi:leucyl aminopeptidase (aminopeptidase T)
MSILVDDIVTIEIAKLLLQPGDVLVVRVPIVTHVLAERIHESMRNSLPPGVRVLVVDRDVELSVLTRAEIEARIA